MHANKAGYTATSCGRVGRGGNAGFRLFDSMVTDGPTDRPTDGPMDGPTDGRTDKASYRVACPQLKSISEVFRMSPIVRKEPIGRRMAL